MEKMIPSPEQENAIQRMVSEPTGGILLAAEMGTGKTLLTVETALRKNAETILIIAPLGTRRGWENTFRAQGWDGPIERIETKNPQALEDLKAGKRGVYIVGREYFRLAKMNWTKIKPDLACYDEAHGFANRKSAGFRHMKTLKAKTRIASSGTWFGNKFENAWAVTRWLWPDLVDTSFWRWVERWAKVEVSVIAIPDSRGGRKLQDIKKVTQERNPGAYASAVPCYIYLKSSDDLRMSTEYRHVELTATQRKIYAQMEKDSLAWFEEHPLVADLPIAQRTRLRQIALAVPTVTPYETEDGIRYDVSFAEDCKSSKFDALKEILSDVEDEPVVILTTSAKFASVVAARLGDKAALWAGSTKQAERETLLTTFGEPGGPQYLVAVISALGAGIDGLQKNCNTMVWLDTPEGDDTLKDQVEARLVRRGQTREVRSFEILAQDTLDEGIMSRLLAQAIRNRQSRITVKEN